MQQTQVTAGNNQQDAFQPINCIQNYNGKIEPRISM